MPSALVHVMQKIEGIAREKVTTWAVKQVVNGNGSGTLDDPTIALFIGSRLAGGSNQGIVVEAPDLSRSVVEAILNFHLHAQGTNVTISRVVVNDGKTPGISKGPRAIVPINLACFSDRAPFSMTITKANCAPANIALKLLKSPVVSAITPGFNFLRCAIPAEWVIAGDEDGATIQEGRFAAMAGAIANGLVRSGVQSFFARPAGATTYMQIGQAAYYTVAEYAQNPALKGVLKVTQAITKMGLENAKPRQTTAGKRRKQTAAQLAKELDKRGVVYDKPALLATDTKVQVIDTGARPGLAEAEAQEKINLDWLDAQLALGDPSAPGPQPGN